jgi:thiol-disulfide isomerase/thioredoxin
MMIWFLAVGVVMALVLGSLNLVLLFAVVRRLDAPRAGGGRTDELAMVAMPRIGSTVGQFRVETVEGRSLTLDDLMTGSTLLCFVSPTCPPCKDVLSELADLPAERVQRLVVAVLGTERDAVRIAQPLPTATVVQCSPGDELGRAFGNVESYPTVVRIVDGVVAGAGTTVRSAWEPQLVMARGGHGSHT